MPPQTFLSDFVFPDHWWDRQIIEDAQGQVFPLGTTDKDGQPIQAVSFVYYPDLPMDLEDRKRYIRKLVLDHLAPIVRTVVDPNHGPPPVALTDGVEEAEIVETPALNPGRSEEAPAKGKAKKAVEDAGAAGYA